MKSLLCKSDTCRDINSRSKITTISGAYLLLFSFILSSYVSHAQKSQIDTFLINQMKEHKIPAISVAIIEQGKIVLSETYGKANLEYNIPNSNQTAFQLASATKLITTTALMTLVQDGKLDLHRKVHHYLPELPSSWDDMTVMDHLSHQSGMADILALKQHYNNVEEALDTAASKQLMFKPGTQTVYGGGDYLVVLKLIEKISGKPFQQFLSETIFQIIGMNHTVFNNMDQDFIYRTYDAIPFAATTYKWDSDKKQQRIFSMMFPSWTYASGGLFSSIEDLSKWAVALDNFTILKPEIQEKLWTTTKLKDGSKSPFGAGWIVAEFNGQKATGHSGGPALADIARLPEKKITVIVLTNQLELRPFLTMKVLDMYLQSKL